MSETEKRSHICEADEDFWDGLLMHIEDRKVIPVLGRELINVTIDGQEIPLYQAVAERLLKRHGFISGQDVILRSHQELNDAVSYVLKEKPKEGISLYFQIKKLLDDLIATSEYTITSESLRELAGITNFDLFITTTFDDLLINTLDETRNPYAAPTGRIIFSPFLSKEEQGDLSEERLHDYRAVFYLFGRASATQTYAIHDEDTLEYIYNLLGKQGIFPARMVTEARNRNLLFIGCNFANWLSRFFIRLATKERLSNNQMIEFLVGKEVYDDETLTVFLERFSQNTRLFACDARSFIMELVRRWRELHPYVTRKEPDKIEIERPIMAIEPADIFVSYSRTDLAAAKTLYTELEELGARVIWFDKTQNQPGDEFDTKIMTAIRRCKVFLPLISLTTESRTEGFFRKEWKAAEERSERIQGQKFIIPVVIDQEYNENASEYELIPEGFRKYHFGHAPMGHLSEELRSTLIQELRKLRGGGQNE